MLTLDQSKEFLASIQDVPEIVLDLETDSLNTRKAQILAIGISGREPSEAVLLPPDAAPLLLELDRKTVIVGHNLISYDLNVLRTHGVDLRDRRLADTMLMHHLYDENLSHSLDSIIQSEFNDNYKEVFWSKYDSYQAAPADESEAYAIRDVGYTLRLYHSLLSRLRDRMVPDSLTEHVVRLALTLADTEYRGVLVDLPYLMDLGVKLKSDIEGLLPKMREAAKTAIETCEYEAWLTEIEKRKTDKGKAGVPKPEFNFDSPKQLVKLLYSKLKLPVQKNEKTKEVSADWDALEKIKDEHKIVELIQEYREKHKVYGSYIEGTLERLDTGRIFPEFRVNGTATGRISHSNPNLGQLPRTGGVRGIYVPDPGHVFISADYSQLEVCLAAHFTQDKNLLSIVLDGRSQHDITAEALGIDRQKAKTVNFALQYGASHFKLARVLGVSGEEGKKAFDRYWNTYFGQKLLMEECRKKVDAGLAIVTPFGRRRNFEQKNRNPWDKAYRQAWNALVQGTGADCTSRALYLVDEELKRLGWGYALFSVHDEIIISAKAEKALDAGKLLTETMVRVGRELNLTVPLKTESSGFMTRWED